MNEQDEPMSEEALLRSEAEHARLALQEALLGIKQSLICTADPKAWAQTHPWVSVGVAAATGFAAATAIVPAPGQRAAERWSGLIHRMAPRPPVAESATSADAAPNQAAVAPSFWTSVVDSLFDLAKVAVTNLITALVQARAASSAVHDAMGKSPHDSIPSEVRSD